MVATGAGEREPCVLVPVACVACALPARKRLLLDLSRAHLESGQGVRSLEAACRGVDPRGMCSSRRLAGLPIQAQDGIAGRVADLLVDDVQWCVEYMIVEPADSAGGRQILVPLDWVGAIDLERGAVRMRCARAALRSAPLL